MAEEPEDKKFSPMEKALPSIPGKKSSVPLKVHMPFP